MERVLRLPALTTSTWWTSPTWPAGGAKQALGQRTIWKRPGVSLLSVTNSQHTTCRHARVQTQLRSLLSALSR
jgi:hypothetical protein